MFTLNAPIDGVEKGGLLGRGALGLHKKSLTLQKDTLGKATLLKALVGMRMG